MPPEAASPAGQRFTLDEPWSVMLLDDARMIHETTPIQPLAEQGWRDTLVHAGALVPALARGDWSARSGYQAAREILENPGVTAIFAANDTMALGALHALHERGLSCPDDVSLVGFDDIPEAEFFAPGLTTLRQDFDEVGRRSVGLLIDMIENDLVPEEPPLLEPTLIVRGSTAAPAR